MPTPRPLAPEIAPPQIITPVITRQWWEDNDRYSYVEYPVELNPLLVFRHLLPYDSRDAFICRAACIFRVSTDCISSHWVMKLPTNFRDCKSLSVAVRRLLRQCKILSSWSRQEKTDCFTIPETEAKSFLAGFAQGRKFGQRQCTVVTQAVLTATAAQSGSSVADIERDAKVYRFFSEQASKQTGVCLPKHNFSATKREIKANQCRVFSAMPTETESKVHGRTWVNCHRYDSSLVVYINAIRAQKEFELTDSDSAEMAEENLENSLRVALIQENLEEPVEFDIQSHLEKPPGSATDPVDGLQLANLSHAAHAEEESWYFTCRLAFASIAARTSAENPLRKWSRTYNANFHLGYDKQVVEVAHWDIPTKVVPRVLIKADRFGELPEQYTPENPYLLFAGIFYDKSRRQVVGAFWVMDPNARLLSTRTSFTNLQYFLMYVGGEELLCRFAGVGAAGLEELSSYVYTLAHEGGVRAVRVIPKIVVTDHHAGNILDQSPAGTNDQRSLCTNHLMRFVGRVPYQGDPNALLFPGQDVKTLMPYVGDMNVSYENFSRLVQLRLQYHLDCEGAGKEVRSFSAAKERAVAWARMFYKKQHGPPALCRKNLGAKDAFWSWMIKQMPLLHNIHFAGKGVLGLIFEMVVPDSMKGDQLTSERMNEVANERTKYLNSRKLKKTQVN